MNFLVEKVKTLNPEFEQDSVVSLLITFTDCCEYHTHHPFSYTKSLLPHLLSFFALSPKLDSLSTSIR